MPFAGGGSVLALTMESLERTKFWRVPTLDGLDLLHAAYVHHSFARHMHEEFALGVIEKGALGFFYRGENLVASPRSINLCNPGEVHTGHSAVREGWTYRMFYLHPDWLTKLASQAAGKTVTMPFFRAGVIFDTTLADRLDQLHRALEESNNNALEQESLFISTMTQMVLRHTDEAPPLPLIGKETHRVKKIKEYLEAHHRENISIEHLTRVAWLSQFHLIRVFQHEVGIPPHVYLTQVRIKHAKKLLAAGHPIAQVAVETGFVDQSHLHRQFKRITGITPGQYSRIVQS